MSLGIFEAAKNTSGSHSGQTENARLLFARREEGGAEGGVGGGTISHGEHGAPCRRTFGRPDDDDD